MGQQTSRIIDSQEVLEEGVRHLAAKEPRFAGARERAGALPLRRSSEGFEALLDTIVGQQVSAAAGHASWGRIVDAGLTDREKVLCATLEALRACGLSRQKARYARALAEADVDFGALGGYPDEEIVSKLIEIKGIGRWTAELYAMSSLGRPDIFPAGDLALQESARMLFDLESRP